METGETIMMRLDKLLAHAGYGTRKEVKALIKAGQVSVNGSTAVKDKTQVDEYHDTIAVDGEVLQYEKYHFIMLHKPAGVVSATTDNEHETVLDCVDAFIGDDMFVIGRLDIDTEGLILLGNDGKLAHRLLSPKHHVEKCYEVHIDAPLSEQDMERLCNGLDLGDFTTQKAKLNVISERIVELIIHEGKYHQVKRMMQAVGREVLYLKRTGFGPLNLDPTLERGEWRYLNEEEVNALYAL